MPSTCVIVLNWNNKEDTTRCLESLKQVERADIILVDNGSEDGSQAFFKEHYPNVKLIETKFNLGYAGGNNVGIEYGLKMGYDHFLILNNDTVVDSQIVHEFLQGFDLHPEAGILGGKNFLMEKPDHLDHFGGIWNQETLDFSYYGYREKDDGRFDEMRPLDYVCGASIMVRREVFEEIGLFDPRFFLFWEETDFCFRARYAGFAVMTCPRARLWHKVSASFTGGKPQGNYFFWRNRFLWIERNFNGVERGYLFAKLFVREVFPLVGKHLARLFQVKLKKLRKQNSAASSAKVTRYRAALLGVKDYLFRRFYLGSSKKYS